MPSATMTPLQLAEVTTEVELAALGPEWGALWSRIPAATPFQAPEWLLPWWRHFGRGELWVLALRHESQLVGMVPWFACAGQVAFIGTGNSDCLDWLVEPRFAVAAAEMVCDFLIARQDRWEGCDFQQLPPDSLLLSLHVPANWQDEITVQEACPVLHFPLGATELAAVIPANLRQNLRYYRARAERLGTVRIERADASNFDELFATLLNLHAARWSAAGQAGVLADTIARQFHHDAARELLRRGLLRLCVLSIGDRAGAALYALCGGSETCFYLGGYDPEFRALSLGSLLIAHAVAEALAEGAAAFDFLRGREPYKYRWGAVDRLHYRRQIFSRG